MKRILIIDDHEVVRDGVKRIFDPQPGSAAFGEASTGSEALRLVREKNWDVAVLDISLKSGSGLDVLKELKRIRPNLPVLIFTMHSEDQYARRAFKSGASGYLTKDSPQAELLAAIERTAEGGRYVSPELAEKLVVDLNRVDADADLPPHAVLSDREFEVLRLIGSGKTLSEIAELLSLSPKTVSTYRARILQKMGMKTNAELTRYAVQAGLVH